MGNHLAAATTLHDYLMELGGISADRLRLDPSPGQATLADLAWVNDAEKGRWSGRPVSEVDPSSHSVSAQ